MGQGHDGLWGWGKPLESYFDSSKLNVENQALGGTSSRSYIYQKHWERVLALVKPGDYVMMQFGHNHGGGANNGRGSLRGNGEETEDVTVITSPTHDDLPGGMIEHIPDVALTSVAGRRRPAAEQPPQAQDGKLVERAAHERYYP